MHSEKSVKTKESVLLPALPALQSFELRTQRAIFKMLGVDKQMRAETEKLAQFLGVKKPIEGLPPIIKFPLRKFLKSILNINTQSSREAAIKIIDELIKRALAASLAKDISERQRIDWIRTVAYLYQVYKSLLKEIDANRITDELEKLKKLVNEELEKGPGES